MITLSTIIVQDPDVVSAKVDDCTMLMSIELGKYMSLNPVATRIWESAAEQLDVRSICTVLEKEFEVAGDWHSQVFAFVEQLAERKLIRMSEPG